MRPDVNRLPWNFKGILLGAIVLINNEKQSASRSIFLNLWCETGTIQWNGLPQSQCCFWHLDSGTDSYLSVTLFLEYLTSKCNTSVSYSQHQSLAHLIFAWLKPNFFNVGATEVLVLTQKHKEKQQVLNTQDQFSMEEVYYLFTYPKSWGWVLLTTWWHFCYLLSQTTFSFY